MPVPSDTLDYLIAGTSCVDFSTLNTKSKKAFPKEFIGLYPEQVIKGKIPSKAELDIDFAKIIADFVDDVEGKLSRGEKMEYGESIITFASTIHLIITRRPRIVIFENVATAPWDSMQNFWLARSGYFCLYEKVNSVEYYLPQTRARGYMIGVDVASGEFDGKSQTAYQLVKLALEYFVGLKRHASAPITRFLIGDDDPRFRAARMEMSRDKHRSTHQDWIRCQTRHRLYVLEHGLDPHVRPFSMARIMNGKTVGATPPSRSWVNYFLQQPTRIQDFLDIKVQEHLRQQDPALNCDIRYKWMIFDVSQNVDRNSFNPAKLGVAPIVTPSGQPIFMYAGRPITGLESLTFQGIPINQLQLANESQTQLQSLAGNAMSVTVVGAAIYATQLALSEKLEQLHDNSLVPSKVTRVTAADINLVDNNGSMATPEGWNFVKDFDSSIDWQELNGMIDATSQRCHCQFIGIEQAVILQCVDCSKFVCEKCRGNPVHNLVRYPSTTPRQDAFKIKTTLMAALPGVFTLKWPARSEERFAAALAPPLTRMDEKSPYVKAVTDILSGALSKGTAYYLDHVKVHTNHITIDYKSKTSIARLILKRDEKAWYILPCRGDQASQKFSGVLEWDKPIAKGSIWRETINPEVVWNIWRPVEHQWRVTVSASQTSKSFTIDDGSMQRQRPVHHPDFDLENHVRTMVSGTYHSRPLCGTAEDKLSVKYAESNQELNQKQHVYFFRDVHPTRFPALEADCYVFTYDIELQETQQLRGDEVFANYKPSDKLDGSTMILSVKGSWVAAITPEVSQPAHNFVELVCHNGQSFQTPRCNHSPGLPDETLLSLTIPLVSLPLDTAPRNAWSREWHLVEQQDLSPLFTKLAFLGTAFGGGRLFTGSQTADVDSPFVADLEVGFCLDCCPNPPILQWTNNQPWEAPDQVVVFNNATRDKALPLIAVAHVHEEHGLYEPACERLYLSLIANFPTLGSRAAMHIAYDDNRPREYSSSILKKIRTAFQVEFGMLLPSTVAFAPFHTLMPTTESKDGLYPRPFHAVDEAIWEATGLPDEVRHQATLDHVLNIHSFSKNNAELRIDQSRSVMWMLARELNPAPF